MIQPKRWMASGLALWGAGFVLVFAAAATATGPGACEAETCVDRVSLNAPGEACELGLPCVRPYTNAGCNNTFQGTTCGDQGADTWYTYTTSGTECGELTISTCGGDFDGFLSVYDGGPNCDCPIDESQPLACDDDFCGSANMSQVTFIATADTCYLIRAGGWQASVGAATLQLSIAANPGGCVAVTPAPVLADPAINISGSTEACTSDADCAAGTGIFTSVCRDGFCYARKGRFVSVSPNPVNMAIMTARRVCVDAPGPGAHCRWVDAPGPPITHLGPGPQPILTANLLPVATGAAVYRDWNADPADSQGNIVVHIGGCAVSNGHDYYIQAIPQGADEANEASYSEALILPTQDNFGDVNGDTVPGIAGVFSVIKGFQNTQIQPRTWLKILPSGNDPADPGLITMVDALGSVRAFQQQTYEQQPGGGPPSSCD